MRNLLITLSLMIALGACGGQQKAEEKKPAETPATTEQQPTTDTTQATTDTTKAESHQQAPAGGK